MSQDSENYIEQEGINLISNLLKPIEQKAQHQTQEEEERFYTVKWLKNSDDPEEFDFMADSIRESVKMKDHLGDEQDDEI